MATVYGKNYTKAYISNPTEKIATGDVNGHLKCLYDEYDFSAIAALNDVLVMGKLPAGARVHNVVLSSADLGTTGDVTVGWLANGVDAIDEDGFIPTVDVNAAAINASMAGTSVPPAGMFKEFSVETSVAITFTEATTATSGTIKLAVYYTVD